MSLIQRIFGRPSIRDRRYERFNCEVRAELFFPEKNISLHGMLIEASRGGAQFREASRYILDRRKANVILKAGSFELGGTIVNVRSSGYGVRFEELLTEAAFDALREEMTQRQAA